MSIKRKLLPISAIAFLIGSLAIGGWVMAQESSGAQDHLTAPQLIEALELEWNDEQDAILADGFITLDEYNGTLDRVAACLEQKGFVVHREESSAPGGADDIWMEGRPAGDARTLIMGCYEQHRGKLSIIWAEQNRPTAEQLNAYAVDINACLESKGIVPAPAEELDEKGREAYLVCVIEVPPAYAPRE